MPPETAPEPVLDPGADSDADLTDGELLALPPVVAVVVTHDPGPWFDSALAALQAQDYGDLSILVIDAASADDPTTRVATVAPSAFVRRLATDPGWPAAANEALGMVQGAAYLLFCHDDVAAAPDAVRLLVEEAYRSNAGVIGPKIVDWDEHVRIVSVGETIDKTGVVSPIVEPGELDQEQHDAVRDVFAVDGCFMLVRADLAVSLGGFEPKLWPHGEDIDFCWRAQIAGARVIVAPAARASHRAATRSGHRAGLTSLEHPADRRDRARHRDEIRAHEVRHRVRMVLTNYSIGHLVRVVPQLVLVQLAELAYALVAGRRRVAAAIVGGWSDVLRDLRSVRATRKRVNANRLFPDSEVRRLQARGFARVNQFIRGQLHGEDRARAFAESSADLVREIAGSRAALVTWAGLVLVLLVGLRGLIFDHLPAVGQFTPAPGVGTLARQFLSGWRLTGLGGESPAPPSFALLAAAGTLLFGAGGQAQKLLVIGMLPLGLFGAYRLARNIDVPRAGLLGLIAYAVVPLPYAAFSRGRWDGLVADAFAPYLFARMRRGAEGLGTRAAEPADGRHREPFLFEWRAALGTGIVLAIASSFVPGLLAMTLVLAVGIAAGSVLVGEAGDARRALEIGATAVGIALLLLAPWSFTMLSPQGLVHATFGPGLATSSGLSLGSALRLETGRIGGAPFGWALLIAALLPIVIGRGWRFSWAVRCWTVVVVDALFVVAVGRGWLGLPVPSPDLFLAPAAIALAWLVALGFIAFRVDLSEFRFGVSQAAAIVASVAFAFAALPIVGAASSGRYDLATSTFAAQLGGYLDTSAKKGDYRVLWVGDPEALPLASWPITDGLAYGTSRNGVGDLTDQWAPTRPGPSRALGDAVKIALNGRTTRLGHLLGPMAVRYVVIPRRVGPHAHGRDLLLPSRDVVGALAEQVDFRQLDATNDIAIFENAAWIPARATLTSAQADNIGDAGKGFRAANANELSGLPPALRDKRSDYSYAGKVASGSAVYFAETPSPRWHMRVNGHRTTRANAYGFGSVYAADDGGKATLRYSTSILRYLSLLLELAVWVVALRAAWNFRRSTRGEVI
jgi:GT2 family glycosyltransferase